LPPPPARLASLSRRNRRSDGLSGSPGSEDSPSPRLARRPPPVRARVDSWRSARVTHDDGASGNLIGVQGPGPPPAPRRLVVHTHALGVVADFHNRTVAEMTTILNICPYSVRRSSIPSFAVCHPATSARLRSERNERIGLVGAVS